jgi:hypothetical protein
MTTTAQTVSAIFFCTPGFSPGFWIPLADAPLDDYRLCQFGRISKGPLARTVEFVRSKSSDEFIEALVFDPDVSCNWN